jgi:hypothetical protein
MMWYVVSCPVTAWGHLETSPHQPLHEGCHLTTGDGDGHDGGGDDVAVRDGDDVRAAVAAVNNCAGQRASLRLRLCSCADCHHIVPLGA